MDYPNFFSRGRGPLFLRGLLSFALLLLTGLGSGSAESQNLDSSLLQDINKNGVVELAAFGDSITRGEGDFTSPNTEVESTANITKGEAGYPLRIEAYLGLSVANWGNPGEAMCSGGSTRFFSLIQQYRPDVVIIAEGSNDARSFTPRGVYHRNLQMMINVARAVGTVPVLSTIIPATQNHRFLNGPIDTYNPVIKTLAYVNGLTLADPAHAFYNTCKLSDCALLNRPEGLHPNQDGYDVLGETMISTLLNINLFAIDGPSLLAQAIGLTADKIRTQPDPVPAPTS